MNITVLHLNRAFFSDCTIFVQLRHVAKMDGGGDQRG